MPRLPIVKDFEEADGQAGDRIATGESQIGRERLRAPADGPLWLSASCS